MRTEKYRLGQAMIEMAIGMLVFTLILSGLLMFGKIIPESMKKQYEARCYAGYDAQIAMTGSVDGKPLPQLDEVFAEPEVAPVTPDGAFMEATEHPLEYRMMQQIFSVELDPVARQWYWNFDGKSSFRGNEECYMPLMRIPEFSETEARP